MEKDYPDCFECLNLMDEDYPNFMECLECKEKRKRERLRREKALKRPSQQEKERIARFHIGNIVALEWEKLEMEKKRRMKQIGVGHEEEEDHNQEPPRKMNRRNGIVIKELSEEDRVPEKYEEEETDKLSIEEKQEPWRQMEIYNEDEDRVHETYKEEGRLVEEESEKPSIEEEEDPWRPMKNYVDSVLLLLQDDLEIRWNERMGQIRVGHEEQKPQSLNQNRISNDEEEEPCTLNEGDILADLKEMGEMNSERKPRTQIGEEKPRRSNRRRRRLEIEISDDEELEPSNDVEFVPGNSEDKKPKKKKKKVNNNNTNKKKQKAVAPRVEVVVAPRVEVREGDDPPPDLPENFKTRIREMNGSCMILVLQKQLFKTDIETGENRLSIPLNQIRREFLTEEEKVRVVEGMKVVLIQPSLEESIITFKKWKMKQNCYLYVFTKEWKLVVVHNSLEAGNVVQVWSFRVGSELRFAIVRVNQ